MKIEDDFEFLDKDFEEEEPPGLEEESFYLQYLTEGELENLDPEEAVRLGKIRWFEQNSMEEDDLDDDEEDFYPEPGLGW